MAVMVLMVAAVVAMMTGTMVVRSVVGTLRWWLWLCDMMAEVPVSLVLVELSLRMFCY